MGKIEYGGLKETGKILVQEKYIWIEFKKITTIKPFCLLRGWQKNSAEMIQIITLMKNIRLKEGILSTEVTRKKCICSIILHVIL